MPARRVVGGCGAYTLACRLSRLRYCSSARHRCSFACYGMFDMLAALSALPSRLRERCHEQQVPQPPSMRYASVRAGILILCHAPEIPSVYATRQVTRHKMLCHEGRLPPLCLQQRYAAHIEIEKRIATPRPRSRRQVVMPPRRFTDVVVRQDARMPLQDSMRTLSPRKFSRCRALFYARARAAPPDGKRVSARRRSGTLRERCIGGEYAAARYKYCSPPRCLPPAHRHTICQRLRLS